MNIIDLWRKLKGFKTVLVVVISFLITITETLGATNITEGMCHVWTSIGALFGKEWTCSAEAIKVFFATINATLLVWLSFVTNTPIFEKEPIDNDEPVSSYPKKKK